MNKYLKYNVIAIALIGISNMIISAPELHSKTKPSKPFEPRKKSNPPKAFSLFKYFSNISQGYVKPLKESPTMAELHEYYSKLPAKRFSLK